MKKILCFTIVLCFTLGSLTAQQNYFIAGNTSGVIYYDIEPDISLAGIPYSPPETYRVDIDLNGTDDFLFEATAGVSAGTEYWKIRVKSYGYNKIAYSRIEDSIFYMGIGLQQGDTINNDLLFTDETVYLKLYDYGPSWYYYYSWTSGKYIPVCRKIGSSSECIYGWIKVYGVTLEGITLDSHAVDITTTTVYGSPQSKDFNIYPNPFTTSITLSYTLEKPENVQFIVYNVQSQIVYTIQERQDKGEQKMHWNASGLPAGMYYFRIQAGERFGTGKIIKMD